MPSEQLLDLGLNQVVYLKSGMCEGKVLFVLFGANGTPVIAVDNVDAAVETATGHGLSSLQCTDARPVLSLPQASSRIASLGISSGRARPAGATGRPGEGRPSRGARFCISSFG